MESKPTLLVKALTLLLLFSHFAYSQGLPGYSFRIVNMIPNALSDEVSNDAETNIAVNPLNPSLIAGSAFTFNPSGSLAEAPVYISSDGGSTWALNNIVPSNSGATGDISLAFGSSSGMLYAGILYGGLGLRTMILRTSSPTASTMMTVVADRPTLFVDQPFVSAVTANDGIIPRDRVFSGDMLADELISFGGTGRTAEVMFSNDAGSTPPTGFANQIVEQRNTFEQDLASTRVAIHPSGVVYAIYYRWTSGEIPDPRCDVIVVRDDNFGTGATRFSDLVDVGDGLVGQRVVISTLVPVFGTGLGSNRMGGNLAIAVDPANPANVFIAWCDRIGTTDHTLHFRRSTTSGRTWDAEDWLRITNATNAGIAITPAGTVGLIYQQVTGSGVAAQWETHFRFTTSTGTSFTDDILSTFLNSDLNISSVLPGFLGDYLRIQAVGSSFYGIFPAGNRPVLSQFPRSVVYSRNVDFLANQLRNVARTTNVAVSVDPFFFKISPISINICALHPAICELVFVDRRFIRLPPYPPCLQCPWPCLTCPPFEILIEDMYKQAYSSPPKTILSIPYFHLILEGFHPQDFDMVVVNSEGESVKQELNKTDKGFAISFRPSRSNFSSSEGIKGLKLMALPKTSAAAERGANIRFRFEASDYRFKEFVAGMK